VIVDNWESDSLEPKPASTYHVQIRFTCEREIAVGFLRFDKYRVTTLPTKRDRLRPSGEEALLEFDDVLDGRNASHPEREGEYILAWLSVVFGMKVDFRAAKIDIFNVTTKERKDEPKPITSDPGLNSLFRSLRALDEKGARQYLRGCESYMVAISVLEKNPTLSMFMLVTAVECLSNIFATANTHYERFRDFILSYLPHDLEPEKSDPKFLDEILRSCYAYRSGFTHGGSPLSPASKLAERAEKKYVRHLENGRKILTPSLRWFENIVRSVLMEFLSRQSGDAKTSLALLAMEEATLMMRARRAMQAGRILSFDDVELG
jgi:hypothetical protein